MGDLVVGSRSGPGEPEGRGPSVGSLEEEAVVNPGDAPGGPGGPEDRHLPAGDPDAIAHGGDGGGGDGEDDGYGDGEDGGKHAADKPRSFWKELPILVVIALVLALIIKTFLVQAFSIPSDSMQDTLQRGDRVLVDKLTPWFGDKPSRGEVVVFHDPGHWLDGEPPTTTNPVAEGVQKALSFIGLMPSATEKDLIKRVIAVGGDTVECKGGDSPVIVNGKPLNEPFIYPGNTPCGDKPFGPIKIQPGKIWVMGDHRQDSEDSRYHQDLPGGGQVPDSKVVGRAIVIAWPLNRITDLPIPATYHQSGIDAAASASAGVSPAVGGVIGAVPLVLWRRRRILRTARRG
ncbi:signal peptidase I [Streptomyces sp. SL13]|uniref:Signal peptidase I n=1 Tax=Streptantibioticus silvisoli TaxID=2705255 RepID=A0AA90H073_9ACTN|nr:signal peptidase I [Streptantibioticus silvisoli]MDI5967541.1 signal peptidase I [Streptantibioticus silvisoli]MDI5968494.1 signal peptidase I [Streptantibioticus silvisoli]